MALRIVIFGKLISDRARALAPSTPDCLSVPAPRAAQGRGAAGVRALSPKSAAARYERERVAAWVRARLTPYPMDRCCYCRLPFNVGQQWQEVANDAVRVRFHAACYAEWRD